MGGFALPERGRYSCRCQGTARCQKVDIFSG